MIRRVPFAIEILTGVGLIIVPFVLPHLGFAPNTVNRILVWGLFGIGFDILCGVGLAAGGFTLVAVVHIFNIERYKPILRPAILTAFLGATVSVARSVDVLLKPGESWQAFRRASEGMKREYRLYLNNADKYT